MADNKKKAMGKGLGALFDIGDQGEFTELHVERITPNPYQPREISDDESLSNLAGSIKEHGIIQPLTVRKMEDDRYQIIAGERRWRAASMAGLNKVPVIIKDFNRKEMMQVALIENLQREDLNPIEEARAYRRIIEEFELTQMELSESIGISRSSISNAMRLLNLPSEIQNMLAQKKISEGHARAVLSLDSDSDQIELCREIENSELSVREAEKKAKEYLAQTREHSKEENQQDQTEITQSSRKKDVSRETKGELVRIEEKLQDIFKTMVTIRKTSKKGKIEIEFYTEDDLNRIMDILLS